MCRDDGVGLAAPQVGVNVRLMVFNPDGKDKPGNEYILVNPEITATSKTSEMSQEGCLSFPKIYTDIEVRGAAGFAALCSKEGLPFVPQDRHHGVSG